MHVFTQTINNSNKKLSCLFVLTASHFQKATHYLTFRVYIFSCITAQIALVGPGSFIIVPYHAPVQGRNMVYPGPIDPYFLALILIPEPHFPQNFDP